MTPGERARSTLGALSPAELCSPARNPFLRHGVRLTLRRWVGLALLSAALPSVLTLLFLWLWWDIRRGLPPTIRVGWAPPPPMVDFLWLVNLVPLGAWASGLGNMMVYREYVQETLPFLRTCPWTPLEWTLKRSVFPAGFLLLLALTGLPVWLALGALGSIPLAAAGRLTASAALCGIAGYVLFLTQSPWASDAMRRPWLQRGAARPRAGWRRRAAAEAAKGEARRREAEYGATAGWGIGWVILLLVVAATLLPRAARLVSRAGRPRMTLLDAALQAAWEPLPFFAGEVNGALLLGGLGLLAGLASFALAVQVADPDRLHVGTRRFSRCVGALGWLVGVGMAWAPLHLFGTVLTAIPAALFVAWPSLYLAWLRRPQRRAGAGAGGGVAAARLAASLARAVQNPVARFDLFYRQREFSLGNFFTAGLLLPWFLAWTSERAFRGLPVELVVLYVSLPVLGLALVAPALGIRLWAADWERRTVAALLCSPLTEAEILRGRRAAAWAMGILPALGIGVSASVCALILAFRDGHWPSLALVAGVGCWALSAAWLQSTGAVDALPSRPGARFWTAIPMLAALAVPFAEVVALSMHLSDEPRWMRQPWPALARLAPGLCATTLALAALNLLLARLLLAWNVRRLHWLRRTGLEAK